MRGDFIYLAPGAKINGNLTIGNNVIIGSNAVITKFIEEDYVTWAGVLAKKISNKEFDYSQIAKK